MPLPGGPADKLGNRYELWWTVSQLVRIMDGQATSIRIEDPTVDKAEFVLTAGDHQELHQAKRSHPNGKWSLSSLGAEGLLQAMFDRLFEDSNARFVFVSGSDAPELRELTERAVSAENLGEFETAFVSANVQKETLTKLKSFWRDTDTATAYEILQRIEVRTIDEKGLEEQVRAALWTQFSPTQPDDVCDALRSIVEDSIHMTIDREFLISTLQGRGFPLRKLARPNDALSLISEAAEKNRQWFADRFKDARLARPDLGQPLAPNDAEVSYMTRDDLVSQAVTQLQSGQSVILLGDEGCGKSWLAAKIIEQQEERTLTALFSAEHLPDSVNSGQAIDLLARQLIRQTDDDPTDDDPNEIRLLTRWRRRIDAWHEQVRSGRFLVVLDGLNQRPEKDWGRIIEMFQYLSEKAGGRLLVTCRSHYFRTKVEKRLFEPLKEIAVPEWTAEERDALLKRSGVDPAALDQQAAKSLLNPRLLGIALQLLHDDSDAWQGLTVERLLFEHIRAAELDSADPETFQDFADRLTSHAREVLDRVQDDQREDLLIFEEELEAVAEGRFFAPIARPKNAYELRQEGLPLALGFALVDRLLSAQENNKDLSESINITLDPIGGLDATPKVVLAALTAITLEEIWFKQDIYESLIRGFALLQNPDRTHYPAFVSLAKEQIGAFLNAAETLTLQKTPHPNFDWIRGALFALRDDDKSQLLVASTLTRWLSYYTLDPEQQIPPNWPSSNEERQEKIKEKRLEIKAKRKSLSEAEGQILEEMHEMAEDPTGLTRLAITLLAGAELAPFARALIRASFSKALNGSLFWPDKEFRHLLSLNSRDWTSARQALLDESRAFRADDSSRTGKWALVSILYGTGEDDDAREASALVKTLREPLPWPKSWRRVEDYCSADPCDPASEKPANVVKTATNYQQGDVTKLHLDRGRTREDLFFEEALPAIARFFPEIAAEKHLELLDQLFVRSGFPLRQLAMIDKEHGPLIDRERALRLVEILRAPSALADIPEKEQWITAQLLLLFAFPFMTASEQLEAMLLPVNDGEYLTSLCDHFKSLDGWVFERRFRVAAEQNDRAPLDVLLAFARYSETPLTAGARNIIAGLIRHETERIRADVFETIYRRELSDLLPTVIESEWRYTDSKNKDGWEAQYGSLALIEAASQGVVGPSAILDCIMPESFGVAARELGPEAAAEIVRRLFVRKNLGVSRLENFSLEDFDTFYRADPRALVDLADLFLGPDSPDFPLIHDVALLTAYAISKDEPEKAKSLFKKVEDFRPFLIFRGRISYGRALWKSAANPLLDDFRRSRLDQAVNDHGLAMEVLAAEQAGRHDILDAYIKAKCDSDTPAVVARGLMVAGLCDDREEPARVLAAHAAHAGRAGLIGEAHSAAVYAFERNRWARHWYQKMAETDDPVQYWVNKCLFAKIVDGRFSLWNRRDSARSFPLFVYHEITEKSVEDRCKRWQQKREKKLFGQDAPEPLFVQ